VVIMQTVTDVPKMSTAPGGPWLTFLSELVDLDEPFKPDEIPSRARREAVSQVAVRRVAEHLRAAGLPASPWTKRCQPEGCDYPRLLCRVYWTRTKVEPYKRNPSGRNCLFTYFDGAVGQSGSLPPPQQRALTQGWDAYEAEIKSQTHNARKALRAQRPRIKRPQRWKFQHLSPTLTLAFAGGSYYLVSRL